MFTFKIDIVPIRREGNRAEHNTLFVRFADTAQHYNMMIQFTLFVGIRNSNLTPILRQTL